jgi:site-specific DNA-methyltransferase (adenine-specific)
MEHGEIPSSDSKTVELLRKIFVTSNPDSIILDPFGGSGTTYAVAEATIEMLGTELKIEFCEIIKNRLLDNEHISRIAFAKMG